MDPFSALARGYAFARPPVHVEVINHIRDRLAPQSLFKCALDIGCGAGLSTKALTTIAARRFGMEPSPAMLKWAPSVDPEACFFAGRAEAIPLPGAAVDLVTAAGSLNYADLDRALVEAARVLTSDGMLIVYDFGPGQTFEHSAALDEWFEHFIARYPWPQDGATELNPDILARKALGFAVRARDDFKIGLTLTPEFYLDYMLTETNIANAVQNGTPVDEIRTWCQQTLRRVWNGQPRRVLFTGYAAILSRSAGKT